MAFWREHEATGEFSDTNDAAEVLSELARTEPETAWEAIFQILSLVEAKPENPLFQSLAAGPLEDLLSEHGRSIIDRVELEARRSPSFNLLLGGVWQGGMPADVWERIQKCRLRAW
ncbi:MAG TPA: hypothetical protein VMF52_16320 [Steroidobacteraceae bacterium]|nr:hypothetical protein [Steroidobacteraceae bacterium]